MDQYLKTGKLGKTTWPAPGTSTQKKKEEKKWPVPWVEKYRPRSIDDVVQQEEVVAVLQRILTGGDLPNLLFYGPPGTGKTSTILAAARQLFGSQFKERILELNASDERGISVIREKVKKFAQFTVSSTLPSGRPCPSFKLVILDEADAMTQAAQSALRRTMEKQTKTTRFCLLCNYLSRIIPPITSRCSKFRFKPLNDELVLERLSFISKEENVNFKDGFLQALIRSSEGDLRRAITSLQSVVRLKGKDKSLSVEDVLEVTGVIPKDWIEKFYQSCNTGNYDKVDILVEELIRNGFPASKLMDQFFHFILEENHLTDQQKAEIFETIGDCNYKLMEGSNEYLQILALGTSVMKIVNN